MSLNQQALELKRELEQHSRIEERIEEAKDKLNRAQKELHELEYEMIQRVIALGMSDMLTIKTKELAKYIGDQS